MSPAGDGDVDNAKASRVTGLANRPDSLDRLSWRSSRALSGRTSVALGRGRGRRRCRMAGAVPTHRQRGGEAREGIAAVERRIRPPFGGQPHAVARAPRMEQRGVQDGIAPAARKRADHLAGDSGMVGMAEVLSSCDTYEGKPITGINMYNEGLNNLGEIVMLVSGQVEHRDFLQLLHLGLDLSDLHRRTRRARSGPGTRSAWLALWRAGSCTMMTPAL